VARCNGGASPLRSRCASAQPLYREFVIAKIGCEDRLWDKLTNQLYLGSENWLKRLRAQIETKPRSTDHPRTQRAAGRPKTHTIFSAVAKAAGETAESIESRAAMFYEILWRGWDGTRARSRCARLRRRSDCEAKDTSRTSSRDAKRSSPRTPRYSHITIAPWQPCALELGFAPFEQLIVAGESVRACLAANSILPASSSSLPPVFPRTATRSLIDEQRGRKMTPDPVTSDGNLWHQRPDTHLAGSNRRR
jgi:hypothetical protein